MASRVGEHVHLRPVGADACSPALLSDKLCLPRAEVDTVPRARLHEAIERGLAAGTVVVSAPAGSGKTTLLAAWARKQCPPRRVAWVTLGESERHPVRFMEYVLAALDSAVADTGRSIRLPIHPVPRVIDELYLAAVAQQLSAVTGEVVLVLDDYQHVIGSATERLIRRILRHPLEHVRLVVLSRRDPDLGQPKLRLTGQLHDLGPTDLAMTLEETAELVRRQGADLSAAELASLHEQTLGWVVGLRAVLTSLGGRSDGDVVEDAMSSARRLIADYLEVEVFDSHPPAMREFLRRVATVDDVCGDLADALTGGDGGARTLADLYHARLFLEPDGPMTDEMCTWYHWNPLFAAVLRTQFRDDDPRRAVDLHLIAADWLRSCGFPVEAVRQALSAGAVDTASAVLAESWFDIVAVGEADAMRSLLPLFDEERLAADPELLVIGAFFALLDHDLVRATVFAREAREGAASLPSDRRFAVEVTSAAVRLRCAGLSGQPDAADLYPSTLDLLGLMATEHRAVTRLERKRRAQLLHALGTFELAQSHYDEAAERLGDAMIEAAALGMTHLLPRLQAQLATLESLTGRLGLARSGALDVIEAPGGGDRTGAQSLAAAHLAVAVVDLHRGSADAALDSLAKARAAVRPVDRMNAFRIGLVRHAALLLQGRIDEAEDELEELHDATARWNAPDWVRLLGAVADADQLLATGQAERALRRMESVAALASEPLANRVWRYSYAQPLLDVGRPDEARALVEPIIAGCGNRLLEVQALIVDCLAAERLGLPEDSLRSLTRAVRVSRRERLVRPFLLRSSQVRPLLEGLLETGTGYEGYVRELLARLPGADQGDDAPWPVEPLTAREIEVLQAMPGATTNDDIAGQMYISLNTLRSHIKQINRKLGTTSRREAVARARRLGLV
jgi:LuxR family transcriptional regulator, maltose regulon positive regulatory protein